MHVGLTSVLTSAAVLLRLPRRRCGGEAITLIELLGQRNVSSAWWQSAADNPADQCASACHRRATQDALGKLLTDGDAASLLAFFASAVLGSSAEVTAVAKRILLDGDVLARAPPELIRAVATACPHVVEKATDCMDRTPLHIAAHIGVDVASLEALFHACPSAATARDCDSMTPLHLSLCNRKFGFRVGDRCGVYTNVTKGCLHSRLYSLVSTTHAVNRLALPLQQHLSARRVRLTENHASTEAASLGPLRPSDVGTVVALNFQSGAVRVRGPADEPGEGWWYPGPTNLSRGPLVSAAAAPTEVVLALLRLCPAAAEASEAVNAASDSRSAESLLCAAVKAGNVDIARALAQLNPAAAATQNEADGRLPLHWACDASDPARRASAEVVSAVLSLSQPEAVTTPDRSELTPLCVALATRADAAVIDALLAAPRGADAAAMAAGSLEQIPLHVACAWDSEAAPGRTAEETEAVVSAAVAALLAASPGGALKQDSYGRTPLAALLNKPEGGVTPALGRLARQLLAACPAAAAVPCSEGRYPVSYALRHNAAPEVVLALLDAHPSAAAEKPTAGDEPDLLLNAALKKSSPAELILPILRAHPAAAMERSGDQLALLPLHTALARRLPLEVVAALIEAHPEGAAVPFRDCEGQSRTFPLHFAVAGGTLEMVELLLKAHPEGVGLQDDLKCVASLPLLGGKSSWGKRNGRTATMLLRAPTH